jgi:hypothetical protein
VAAGRTRIALRPVYAHGRNRKAPVELALCQMPARILLIILGGR